MNRLALVALSLLFAFPLSAVLYAQELDAEALKRAEAEPLVSMPEPPLGYVVTKHPIVADGKVLGFQVQVVKEGTVSKVLIKVETRDLSQRGPRLASCKAYVNGFAAGLKDAGFQIASFKAPDVEKSTFKKPIVVDLTCTNDQGTTLLVRKRIFFTTKGYDVTVVATDEDEFKSLTQWAAQIEPARSRKRR
ncbi:MAG TPA: hypothetical protein ENJ50_04715 [Planctomycetaceae bacterium]|nr:hypothetical protein [Planctomycetaceae bacterium]